MSIYKNIRIMKKIYPQLLQTVFISLFALLSFQVSGQIAVGASAPPPSPFSPTNLVQNFLLGEGVELVSVNFTGNNNALGYFSGGAGSIGFEDGIVLSSGNVGQLGNPAAFFASTNWGITTPYPDLAALTTGNIRDLALLEFTFIPYGDTLSFDWILGSEEYPSWIGSAYNDVFGFFLSGPGITGPFIGGGVNLALLPNGNTATINNVFSNPSFFTNNIGGPPPAFNGYSNSFQAFAIVQPCQQYTIRLAVSDVTDHILDTGVFLRRGSFEVKGIITDIETPNFDNAIAAGCEPAFITFCLEEAPDEEYLLSISVGGTAIPGYHYSPLPQVIWIEADSFCTDIEIFAYSDVIDTILTIELYIPINPCVIDTFEIKLIPNPLVPPPPMGDTIICPGDPVSLNATVPIDLPEPETFYKYDSMPILSPGSGGPPTPAQTSFLVVEDFDFNFVVPGLIESICLNIQGFVGDLNIIVVAPNGQFMPLALQNGGAAGGQNFVNTCFVPADVLSITSYNIAPGGPPFTNLYSPYTGNWRPIGQWNSLWGAPINGTWQLIVDDVIPLGPNINPPLSFATLIDWSITFAPIYDVFYSWSPNTYNLDFDCVDPLDCPTVTVYPETDTSYVVTISDAYGCVFTDTANIFMVPPLPAPLVFCGESTASSVTFEWGDDPTMSEFLVSLDMITWYPPNNGPYSHIVGGLGLSEEVTLYIQGISVECGQPSEIGMGTCESLPCPPVPATAVGTNPLCIGATDGILTITADSPGIYTYAWFLDGALVSTDSTFPDAGVGTYVGFVYDTLNCAGSDTIVLDAPQLLTIETNSEDALCFAEASGTAEVTTIIGGTGTYDFLWSDAGETETQTISGLPAGTYTVSATDGNGCQIVDTVFIAEPDSLISSLVVEDVGCFGENSGIITATITGGIEPYDYLWSDGQSNAMATSLTSGNYTLIITDANDCVLLDSAFVDQPTAVEVLVDSVAASCFGIADGSASVFVTGGIEPYTYLWNDPAGSTSDLIENMPAGTYEVVVTDANSCETIIAVEIEEPEELVISLVDQEDVLCFGDSTGQVQLTATGGVGDLSDFIFTWDDGTIGNDVSNVSAGTYTVTVEDLNGCTDEITFTIDEPLELTITLLSSEALCYGSPTGAAVANVSGGSGDYIYIWSDANGQPIGVSTDTAEQLISGTYTVNVLDANGCEISDTVFVPTAEDLEIVALDSTPTSCFEGNDGTATIEITGGTLPYTYLWSDAAAQETATASGLEPGVYTVLVIDANGCELETTIEVLQPEILEATLDFTPALCYNEASGGVSVTATGGVGSYSYSWANGGTSDAVSDVLAGWHYVSVTDDNGCEYIDSIFVTQPDTAIFLETDMTAALCFNGSTGEASVTAAGGTGPYTYSWNDPANQTGSIATGLAAGTYTVEVTDANGCMEEISVEVEEPELLEITLGSNPLGCFGETTGQAFVTATGGVGDYTYEWVGISQTTDTAQNLSAGTYTVVVSDANGCSATESIEVIEPDPMEIEVALTDVICFGEATGTAIVSVQGGLGSYTYQWSDGQTGSQVSLPAGTFTVAVTDENDCEIIETITIEQPAAMSLSQTSMTPVDCHGASTGGGQVIASGGVGNFTYTWNDPASQSGPQAGNLSAGTYTVIATDANNCTVATQVTVTEPPFPVSVTTESFRPSCAGFSDGSIEAVPAGGTMPYAYNWSGPSGTTGATLTGLTAGTYELTITDANGCITTATTTVEEPESIIVNAVNNVAASCYQSNDGTAMVTVSGGSPGTTPNPQYTFSWNTSPVQLTQQAVNLKGGSSYTVIVTDANGCTAATSITIDQPEPISIETDAIPALCYNEASGVARVANVHGGTPSYQYQWGINANNATGDSIPNLAAGVYAVTVTDANGCTKVSSARVEQPQAISANMVRKDVDCYDSATGSLFAQVSGGTPSYAYLWSNGQTGQGAYDLEAGTYSLTITDEHGCEKSFEKEVRQPEAAIQADLISRNVTCFEGNDGKIEVVAFGGTPGYRYSLDGETYYGSPQFLGLEAGIYTVFVKDQHNCVLQTNTVELEQGLPIWIDHESPYVIRQGEEVPLVVAVNQPNGSQLAYQWSNFGPQSLSCYNCLQPTASPDDNTWYYLTVTDANGCTAETMLKVQVEKNRIIYIATAFTPNGDGTNDFLFVQGPEDAVVESFMVFDRWGNQVFNTGNIPLNVESAGWDGRFQGTEMNSGVFTWRVAVRFADGMRLEEAGYSNLIR